MVFSGAALPAAHCCLKVGPLGPADGAAERAEFRGVVHRARPRAPRAVPTCSRMWCDMIQHIKTKGTSTVNGECDPDIPQREPVDPALRSSRLYQYAGINIDQSTWCRHRVCFAFTWAVCIAASTVPTSKPSAGLTW